jgi:hypothetical protein
VTALDWRRARPIEAVLARSIGRTDRVLAVFLDADYAGLRRAAAGLYRSCRADRCRDYLVSAPSREGGGRHEHR